MLLYQSIKIEKASNITQNIYIINEIDKNKIIISDKISQ